MEIEEVKAHVGQRLEETREAAHKEGRSETQKRMQPLLEEQRGLLRTIDAKVGDFTTSWNKLVRKEIIDRSEIEDLLEEHKDTFAALSGQHQQLGKWSGANALVYELSQAIDSDEFAQEYQSRLRNLQNGLADDKVFPDMVAEIAKAATKPLRDELTEARATIKRLEIEARADIRNGQQPPVAVDGRGPDQSRSDTDVLLDPVTPLATIKAIRQRQNAAR